ncbi:hypothetical protein BROSI_A1187 [Candidatus Brocadia sinica JPN1]|uniref:Uncharacterized protein n=1 Tax=Candidatus Brocadia sinica JPN1 TaxID=1197129 RepID=A0ABQ0JVN3_9BACT|nr:hypothetical protein BROSI_A1187 [Candidatus Brocadia sinica JPN1]GIK13793.1 MAG: hypothetical protein BroJett002_25000 [Candidatus Brocadia sinica]GJQ16989.1 MAG: hypothetical protein HBSIN01_09480 [Candidatus Brocadia sinica]
MYWENTCNDLSTGIDLKEKVVGGSILGSDTFIKWVRDTFYQRNHVSMVSPESKLSQGYSGSKNSLFPYQ